MLLLVFVYLTPPPRDFALPPSDDDLVAQLVVAIDRLARLDAPVGGQDWLWRDRGSLRTVCGRGRRRSFRFRTAVMPVVVVVVMVTVAVPVMSRLSRRRCSSSSRGRILWRRRDHAVLLVGIQVDPRIDRHCASRRDEPVHRRRMTLHSHLLLLLLWLWLVVLVEEERCGGELDASSSSEGGGRGRSGRGGRGCLLPARVAARRTARIAASSGRRRRRGSRGSGGSDSGRRRHGARGHPKGCAYLSRDRDGSCVRPGTRLARTRRVAAALSDPLTCRLGRACETGDLY